MVRVYTLGFGSDKGSGNRGLGLAFTVIFFQKPLVLCFTV